MTFAEIKLASAVLHVHNSQTDPDWKNVALLQPRTLSFPYTSPCSCMCSRTGFYSILIAGSAVDMRRTMQPPPPPPPQPYGCTAVGLGPNSLSCLDLSLLLLYIIFLAGLVWAALHWRVFASFGKRREANSMDRAPLLAGAGAAHAASNGTAGVGGAEEHLYSYLEQRLRPLFYQLVRCCCCTWQELCQMMQLHASAETCLNSTPLVTLLT